MALTEVVYKVRSGKNPLCQLTEEADGLRVVLNQTTWDPETGASRGILTILGPDAAVHEVLSHLPQVYDAHTLVDGAGPSSRTRDHTTVTFATTADHMRRTHDPTLFTLEHFGNRAIVEAAVIRDGYVLTRVIAPAEVDLAALLRAYEAGVETGRWDDFKLLRIEEFNPEQQTQGAFADNLTQKQLEVIKTALALGFYNTPRDVTLDDLSNIFGISKAAVHNRLQAAERKVISKFFA